MDKWGVESVMGELLGWEKVEVIAWVNDSWPLPDAKPSAEAGEEGTEEMQKQTTE